MANITYRASTTPTVASSTTAKGATLTNLEVDGNWKSIADDLLTKVSQTSTADQSIQGNFGIGVAPSAWWSSSKAFQIGSTPAPYLSLSQMTAGTADGYMMWGSYLTGNRTFAYTTTGDAPAAYRQVAGSHAWYSAPAGTAGNAITWAQSMTFDASGNLGVGAASTGAKVFASVAGVGFELKQSTAGSATYYVMDNTVESGGKRWRFGYTGATGSASHFSLYNATDAVTSFVVDAAGNLGVGAASTGAKVFASATAAGFELKQSTVGSATYYVMDNTVESGGKRWRFGQTGSAGVGTFSLYNQTDSIPSFICDAAGNIGIGVTPSVNSIAKTIELQSGFNIFGYNGAAYLNGNSYYNSGWLYKNTGAASRYEFGAGTHLWHVAASGASGSAITFTQAMTLDVSGNLMIGATSAASKLTVKHTSGRGNGLTLSTASGSGSISWLDSTGLIHDATAHLFNNGATTNMLLDSSGNLGLGITPSGWGTSIKAIDLGSGSSLSNPNSNSQTWLATNAYYNAGWKYKNTAAASLYETDSAHKWYVAGSGTAASAITFTQAMTLDASGNLGIGITPSAWGGTGTKAIQIGAVASVWGGLTGAYLSNNMYWNGTNYKYLTTAPVSLYYQNGSGQHIWYSAPSGSAGANVTITAMLSLDASGNLQANGNVTAYSDERLKTDWTSVSTDFLSRWAAIKSGTYTRIDSGLRQAGASAQDIQAILPEAVLEDSTDNKYLTVAYGNAALVATVELAKENIRLNARIARLEALIGA